MFLRFRTSIPSILPKTIGLLLLIAALFPLSPPAAKADSLVVTTCGTLPLAYAAGATRLDTVGINGNNCTSGSISIAGFQPSTSGSRGTPLTVTTSDSSGTLPTGGVVIVSNAGTTNPMFCNVRGVAATVSDQPILAGSWFAFTIPSGITTLHCIATGGSTTANSLGGSGIPTGAGGGSGGGGGGGAVTVADGADVTQGAKADAKSTATDTTPVTIMQVLKEISAMEQAPASRAVTNAGTFAVQATQAGTWTVTGTGGSFPIPANSSVNVNQWNATSLGAPTAWGVAPTGNVVGMNVNMIACATGVCNTNGAAATTGSAPVTLPVLSHKTGASAALTSLVVNAAASSVNGYNCTAISGGAAGFCIGYNGTAAPSTGALTAANVLDFCWFDTTARGCSLSHMNGSVAYSTGFVVLISSASTPYTYTTGVDTGAIEGDYN